MMNLGTLARPIRALMALLFTGSLAMSLQAKNNLALNKPATASSSYSGSSPSSAVDGDQSTYWSSDVLTIAGTTQWLTVDVQGSYSVDQAIITFNTTNYPKTWEIQYFNGSTWNTAYSESNNTSSGGIKQVNFPSVTAELFRVLMTSAAEGVEYYTIQEFQLFEATINTFSLTTNVSPTDGGTISRTPDAMSYAPGTVVTLTATPANDYTFTEWNGDVTGSSSTIQITMNGNKTVTAAFTNVSNYNEVEANDSIATANVVPDAASKIAGHISTNTDIDYFKVNVGARLTLKIAMTGPSDKDYDLYLYNAAGTQLKSSTGSSATESITYQNLETTAMDYYIMVKGFKGVFSTTVPYNLTLTKVYIPIVVEVVVKPTTATLRAGATKQFTATVSGTSNPSVTWSCTAGTISNSGLYTAPSTDGIYTVTATSVADSTKSASATVTVDSTYALTTSVSPVGGGTITRSPDAMSYVAGTVVTLTATPATDYTFTGWSGDAAGTTSTIQITINGNVSVTAVFLGSGTTCGIPTFNPTPWNDGSTVQRNNNCYNYSNNVKTNTFAQPGRYCGHMATSMACAQVIAAAKCDGLIQTTKDAVLPPGMTRIALVVADGQDYHWYRQDNNGMWSHKPGQTRAVNVDNSNKPISDPETADRGFYNSFCLYFQICSGEEQFGGHSTIK